MRSSILLTGLVTAFAVVSGCSDGDSSDNDARSMALSFTGLEDLGPDYVYEGWIMDSDGMVHSTGRFAVDADGMLEPAEFMLEEDVAADAQTFILTIEPAVGDDPAPADTHVVAGAFTAGSANLTTSHPAALGSDFASAAGTFILATPTTADNDADFDHGIWFIDVTGGGPMAGLTLPDLPAGWAYEGWVVVGGTPYSTGTFTDPALADADGAGARSGPDGFPPFPGQDFITPPLALGGGTAVISIEPQPDNSPAPFALKPLVGGIDAGLGSGQQGLQANPSSIISGMASIAPTDDL